ncbi:linoleate 13S-lipoxygenase 2-1, chloroplastic-like [Cucumis melo]|uniref:Linoleate 13S-lipoxygenase 2-1, chloroplastic-like n=1 Tax=Cucumis melo TaxID=3656 RepID=A0A1S4DXM1_CUCME|nr:linoleate 13S-lipoxygenase 2-1, chloroplastic-like [Cucumis melo]
MLNSSILYRSKQASFAYQKPFIHRNFEVLSLHLDQGFKPNASRIGSTNNLSVVKESSFAMTSINRPISVKVVVTIKRCINELFPHFGFKPRLDHITNWWPSQALSLEFISVEMDPTTGLEKGTTKAYAEKVKREDNEVIVYETKVVIPADFGAIGGVLVENERNKELFLMDIVIHGIPTQYHLHFPCNSWIQSKDKRIFFTTKVISITY